MKKSTDYIGEIVNVKIDRPMGTKHPNFDMMYPVNYGYVPNTISGDGEELDCYVLGVFEPLEYFDGECIAVIHRLKEDDDKLIIVPKGKQYSNKEIEVLTEFQEKYFKSIIIRKSNNEKIFYREEDMGNTIIYLIRHADTLTEDGIRNTKEDSQIINEKEILSVGGEEQARKLSKYNELKNIDIIWSSSYCRAKETAKYIAYNNNLPINIDSRLNERKLGNLDEIAIFMKDKKTIDPSQEQLLDRKFKTTNGESCEEVNNRMTQFLNKILKEYKENKIAIVSHGGTIKFLLLNWCEVNQEVKLVYEDTVLDITSPCCIKLEFNGEKLIALNQIM